jgi:hypothetical protein
VIQASWNWPFGVKDTEVYGTSGIVIANKEAKMRYIWRSIQSRKMVDFRATQ